MLERELFPLPVTKNLAGCFGDCLNEIVWRTYMYMTDLRSTGYRISIQMNIYSKQSCLAVYWKLQEINTFALTNGFAYVCQLCHMWWWWCHMTSSSCRIGRDMWTSINMAPLWLTSDGAGSVQLSQRCTMWVQVSQGVGCQSNYLGYISLPISGCRGQSSYQLSRSHTHMPQEMFDEFILLYAPLYWHICKYM